MSSAHTTSSATDGLMGKFNALISPRAGRSPESRTVVDNVSGIASKTWDLLKHTTATGVDLPLGIFEAGIAGVNNTIGLITQGVDKAIVQPMDSIRVSIFKLLNKPSTLFAPAAAGAGGGGHH
ncbi:hypothetical protein EXS65_03945 [Candidatus Peribacteria bacterium]|nr:hypothetical protein [Candidatus Peribacteria bacterium]